MATYDAFISYSHAKDRAVATALQSVVQRLGKPWYRRRELRIFRDDTSLSATPHLWPSIEQALSRSRFLILLASPEAAVSRWVNEEAKYWLAHKTSDSLLIALTGGELGWSEPDGDFAWSQDTPLPPALKGAFPSEPKWVDLRAWRAGAGRRDAAFMALAADFAAAVRGIPKEDLLSEEVRQQRRALTLAWSAAGAMLILAIGVGLAGWQAVQQRDRALRALDGGRIAQSFAFDMVIDSRPAAGFPIALIQSVLDRARAMQRQLRLPEMLPDLRRLEAMALRELASTRLIRGDGAGGLSAAEDSRKIMADLVAADGDNQVWRRELSIAVNRIGEALARDGRHQEALALFRQGLALREQLPTVDDPTLQRDLAVSYERIGDETFIVDGPEQARPLYRRSLEIREGVAQSDPGRSQWQADLAVSYDRMPRMTTRADEVEAAFRKSLAIRQKLVADEPGNPAWQADLATAYDNMAGLLLQAGRRDDAMAALKRGLEIRERVADANPDVVRWQANVVISLIRLAEAKDDAPARYARALEIVRRLDGKLPASQQAWQKEIEQRLAALPR